MRGTCLKGPKYRYGFSKYAPYRNLGSYELWVGPVRTTEPSALASCEDSEARRDPEAEAGRGSGPCSMPFVWGWVGGEKLCGCFGGVGGIMGLALVGLT